MYTYVISDLLHRVAVLVVRFQNCLAAYDRFKDLLKRRTRCHALRLPSLSSE
jgi:hypothetical protein